MSPVIKSVGHATASAPRPHILYQFQVDNDGKVDVAIELPPKRILVTAFIPSAWVDETLIAERKEGLKAYLNTLLATSQYKDNETLREFLTPSLLASPRQFDLEDALPSTLSQKAAQQLGAVAAAYYPDWSADSFSPEHLDYSKFDILFSPGHPAEPCLQCQEQRQGTKIVLSAGGWGGSTFFHQAAGSADNRATFVSALSSAVSTFGWMEYPNAPGAGNPFRPEDAGNLLLLLISLRAALGKSKIISAAVTDLPWIGSNGSPLTDISAYATQMTYANFVSGSSQVLGDVKLAYWSDAVSPVPAASPTNFINHDNTSPVPMHLGVIYAAPLFNRNTEAAFSQWTPASKLLLGLPLYGYVLNSTNTGLSGDFTAPGSISAKGTSNGPIRGANKRPAQIPAAPTPTPKAGPGTRATPSQSPGLVGPADSVQFTRIVGCVGERWEQLHRTRRLHHGYVTAAGRDDR
ncbi:glycoside hydrolase superfamily [Mycena capillaripes]|nr:glycoside hydrolase superfamily [Mycena capillaripes]